MERTRTETTTSSFLRNRSILIGATAILALLTVWSLRSNVSTSSVPVKKPTATAASFGGGPPDSAAISWCSNIRQKTFYDDPNLSYSIEKPIKKLGREETANKVDYCRRHGYDVFYNNALLHPKMGSFWAKIPAVRAAMVAHPETEWIWWVDSDAVFTDMDFVPPLERYKDYNLVVGGSPELVYKHPSSIGLHAGVFYIRNCQWSMNFIEAWAKMGPQTPNYEKWGPILKLTIHDKLYPESDDETAMVYLLLKEKDKWANKVLLEHEHCIQGYWEGLAVTLDNVTRNYVGLGKKARRLRRRHAEKVSESYGCQPCSGDHSTLYPSHSCWKAMEKALNFADNQVLRNYGFVHRDLLDSSHVSPVPFDFPS
ncbi:Galactosyl transferase GMA12/MNN10 family protein [Actinidia rufa]|uniref:Galactosyl transferase GMA12/MNN10 family protein n=1 Tax=Actinidia rufa TaxID=165716 RepID=A0A7J0F4W5_9ERIC|nr:Galactosyl transferase GMA12/MNN10 family protein [Actinidia rufa]